MGCRALLQGIFLTQGLNLGLLHCSQTLHCLSRLDCTLNPMTSALITDRRRQTHGGDGPVKTEAEVGNWTPQLQAKEHQGSPAATGSQERGRGTEPPSEFLGISRPSFEPFGFQNCEGINVFCLKPPLWSHMLPHP